MARERAVVLLSGGLDSAYNLWAASREMDVILALTFDYGQRAAESEIRASQKLCAIRGVNHRILELPWFRDFTQTSLVNSNAKVPTGRELAIEDLETSTKSAAAVWIPNRNGVFLNIAAAYAEGLEASVVLTGFNAEEAVTFPDNSLAYQQALNQAFRYSTCGRVRVYSFCGDLSKEQIVQAARTIQMPFADIWPCYFSGDEWCGVCESCQRFARVMNGARQDGQSLSGAEL